MLYFTIEIPHMNFSAFKLPIIPVMYITGMQLLEVESS